MRDPNGRVLTLELGAILLMAMMCLPLGGCGGDIGDANHQVNGDVHIKAGDTAKSADSVNGSIDIDADASVADANTVNGAITMGAKASGTSLRTVNGELAVGPSAHLSGSLVAVNGAISLEEGAGVAGSISNVNGLITISGATVGGGIKTVNGDIAIIGAAHVDGGITVQKPAGGFVSSSANVPRIVIGPGATVVGELRFDRPVKLYVSDHATIGTVVGATAIPFTGEKPAD